MNQNWPDTETKGKSSMNKKWITIPETYVKNLQQEVHKP